MRKYKIFRATVAALVLSVVYVQAATCMKNLQPSCPHASSACPAFGDCLPRNAQGASLVSATLYATTAADPGGPGNTQFISQNICYCNYSYFDPGTGTFQSTTCQEPDTLDTSYQTSLDPSTTCQG